MTHSDPDVLVMLALGEPDVSAPDLAHIRSCSACRSELDRLKRVTRAARDNGPVDFELAEPSPAVWENIRKQLADQAPAVTPATTTASYVAPPRNRADTPAPRDRARSRRAWGATIGGVAALLIAVVLAVVLFAPRSSPQVQAEATLAGLPEWSTSNGTATMIRETDGTTVLQVALHSPAVHSGSSNFREVWLMNTALTKSISVGLLDGTTGRFVMPANIAAADYPVVDISQQPLNGNPAHSGNSIVRGTLSTPR